MALIVSLKVSAFARTPAQLSNMTRHALMYHMEEISRTL